jgi:hypothetical protein
VQVKSHPSCRCTGFFLQYRHLPRHAIPSPPQHHKPPAAVPPTPYSPEHETPRLQCASVRRVRCSILSRCCSAAYPPVRLNMRRCGCSAPLPAVPAAVSEGAAGVRLCSPCLQRHEKLQLQCRFPSGCNTIPSSRCSATCPFFCNLITYSCITAPPIPNIETRSTSCSALSRGVRINLASSTRSVACPALEIKPPDPYHKSKPSKVLWQGAVKTLAPSM